MPVRLFLKFTKPPRESMGEVKEVLSPEPTEATAEPVEDTKEPVNSLPQEIVKQKRKYTKKVVDKKPKKKN